PPVEDAGAVVALDPRRSDAGGMPQPFQPLHRRRQPREGKPGKVAQMRQPASERLEARHGIELEERVGHSGSLLILARLLDRALMPQRVRCAGSVGGSYYLRPVDSGALATPLERLAVFGGVELRRCATIP